MLSAQVKSEDDVLALYQEIILDHSRNPKNKGVVDEHSCRSDGRNPMCGDRVTVTAKVEGDTIRNIKFDGKGCAISIASASLMTDAVSGLTKQEAEELFRSVEHICRTGDIEPASDASAQSPMRDRLEQLAALSGVSNFPVRVKCATLPWQTLISCLAGEGAATTEEPMQENGVKE